MDYDETGIQDDNVHSESEMERTASDSEYATATSFLHNSPGSADTLGSRSNKRTSMDSKETLKDCWGNSDGVQIATARVKRTLQQESNGRHVLDRNYEHCPVTSMTPAINTKPKSVVRSEPSFSADGAVWPTTSSVTTVQPKRTLSNGNIPTVKDGIFQTQHKEDGCTSVESIEPRSLIDTYNSCDIQHENSMPEELNQQTLGKQSVTRDKKSNEICDETQQMQGIKRTISPNKMKNDREVMLSQNFAKLHIQSKKKRQAKKQKEKEVYEHIQQHLESLSSKDIAELFITQDDDGDNLLMIAIIEGCVSLAKCLIHLAPSPNLLNIRNNLGQTALHLTVLTRQYKLTRKLVLAGGHLLARDFIGNSPLHVACSNNDIDSVISLTKVVTSLECPLEAKRESLQVPQPSELYNHKGETCAHIAARNGYTDLVKYLVETRFHADVNAPERLCGKTVLHLAAELGNLDLVKYLLSLKETDCNALTYSHHSVLDLALGRGQQSVASLLQHAGVKPQYMETEEADDVDYEDEDEDERNRLTLQDFQCSMKRMQGAAMEDFQEYDDICFQGKLVQSFCS